MDQRHFFFQNRLTSSLKSISDWPSFTPESGLVFWQELALFYLMVGSVGFAAVLCPPIILDLVESGLWSGVTLYFLLLIWGMAILFLRRLSYHVRAVNAVLLLYVLGLGLMVLAGPYSSSYLWLLGFGIMSAVLLGGKAAVRAFALNAVTIAVLGLLFYLGYFHWNSWIKSSMSPWTFLGMTLLFLNAVSSISLITLIKAFETLLTGEMETSAALSREKKQLRQTHLELAHQVEKQKTVEAALRQTQEYSRNIIDSSLDIIVTLDRGHCIVEFNKAAKTTYGYVRNGIIGQPITSIWAEDEMIAEIDREIADSGRFMGELLNIRSNGQVFPVFVSASALINQAGRTIGTLIIARDVTASKKVEDTLRRSEENYRLLFKEMINGSSLLEILGDENGRTRNYRFLEVNPAFERLFGRPAEELIGKTNRDLPPFADPDWLGNYRLVAESGAPVHFVTYSQYWEKYLEVTVYSPEKGRLAVIYKDISEYKQAEKALRLSEEKYRALFDHALVGMFRISLGDHRLLEINDVFVRMFNFTSKDKTPEFFNLPDQCPNPGQRASLLEAFKKPGRIDLTAIEFKQRDGGRFRADFAARVYPDEGYFEGAVIDVTDRYLAEEARRESETRYSNLFNSISDVIFSHDLQGRVMDVTPLASKKLGYETLEMIGGHVSDFMPDRLKQHFHSHYLDRLRKSGLAEGYFVLKAKDGSERYFEYSSNLIRSPNQAPFVSGVGRDVTERVISRREMKKMEERLRQSQKMEAVGTLASGVAHDFNNILQAISGYVQLILKKGWDDGASRRYIEEVDFVVQRASDLVQQLLAFGRKVEPELVPVDLNREILNTAKMLERTIPKMINIATDLSPDLSHINGDPTQLKQVVMNLATNARDAMPQGGLLLIETENLDLGEKDVQGRRDLNPGAYVGLKVSDTGQGMDKKTIEHIFEPFFTTKGLGEGTGLGLSIVYGIIKGHGGEIVCESEPGRGALFSILLPAQPAASLPEIQEVADPAETPGGRETILIVDDEEQIIQVVRELLEDGGYQTLVADSGEKAIVEYTRCQEEIDLVILDLGMPGMGGSACLERLLGINQRLPVIITSGYSARDQGQRVLDLGARGFLGKPYRLSDLLKTVRQVLDKYSRS